MKVRRNQDSAQQESLHSGLVRGKLVRPQLLLFRFLLFATVGLFFDLQTRDHVLSPSVHLLTWNSRQSKPSLYWWCIVGASHWITESLLTANRSNKESGAYVSSSWGLGAPYHRTPMPPGASRCPCVGA